MMFAFPLAYPQPLITLLLQLHRLAATMQGPIAAFGHNKLRAAFLAHISLSNLIRHLTYLPGI